MEAVENSMIVGATNAYEAIGLGDRQRKYQRKIDPDAERDEDRTNGCPLLEAGALSTKPMQGG